ncbi:MAG TPA: hypothetical protein VMB72_10685, partial [Acidimicrobiales bacterium]|nr:hypothetical protein [Acidimicrobiales bacterium]
LFLRVGGFSALHGFESTFAVLVLLVLAVGTFERRWVALGTLVLGVELVIGYGTGPVVNLSPTYSVAVLSLSAYQLLRRARAPDGAHPLLFAVIGVYSAGIVALRFYFLIPVVLAVVAVAWVTRPGRWVRPVAVVVGTTVVGSLGWMAASWRASGTPLFSVLPGNLGPGVPTGSDPLVHGLTPYLRLFGDVFHVDAVGVVAVLAVVVGVVLLRRRPGQAPEAAVLVFSGLGCLLELVVLTVVFSGSDVNDLVRFEAPSTLACALVVIDVVWPLRPGAAAAPVVPTAGARASRRERLVPAATAGFLVLFALVAFGVDTTRIDHAPRLVRTGTQVLTGAGFGNPYRSLDADYARLNAMIPTGARVLAAVDKPALLDYSRYTFATLDVPGYTSPPPHLPVFASVADQVAYLRHLGYDFVAVESPTDLGLYSEGQWLNEVRVRGYYYRAWSVYYLAWQQTVQGLETDGHYAVRYAGPLALIRLG